MKNKSRSSMKKFLITVQHDEGTIRFTVAALNRSGAVRQIMVAEKCPARAIKKIVEKRS